MSTTTPRTCGELSCEECNARTAALMAERDQLRAALALGQQNCDDAYDDLRDERDQLRARAERAEASLHAATEECTDVRLKWHAVMGTCAAKEDAIMELDDELAAERARLDYLLQWDVTFHDRADIDAELSYGQRKKSTPTLP